MTILRTRLATRLASRLASRRALELVGVGVFAGSVRWVDASAALQAALTARFPTFAAALQAAPTVFAPFPPGP